jgi:hypothetical protein
MIHALTTPNAWLGSEDVRISDSQGDEELPFAQLHLHGTVRSSRREISFRQGQRGVSVPQRLASAEPVDSFDGKGQGEQPAGVAMPSSFPSALAFAGALTAAFGAEGEHEQSGAEPRWRLGRQARRRGCEGND